MSRIVKAGAVVLDRQFMDALDVTCILQCDGGKIRQRLQERQVAIVKAFYTHAVDQLNHAQAMIAKTHRNGHDRARLHFRFFVDFAEETRVLADVRDDDDLLILRHPSGDALAPS